MEIVAREDYYDALERYNSLPKLYVSNSGGKNNIRKP